MPVPAWSQRSEADQHSARELAATSALLRQWQMAGLEGQRGTRLTESHVNTALAAIASAAMRVPGSSVVPSPSPFNPEADLEDEPSAAGNGDRDAMWAANSAALATHKAVEARLLELELPTLDGNGLSAITAALIQQMADDGALLQAYTCGDPGGGRQTLDADAEGPDHPAADDGDGDDGDAAATPAAPPAQAECLQM